MAKKLLLLLALGIVPAKARAGWTFGYQLTLEGSCASPPSVNLPPIPPNIPDQGTCEALRIQVDNISATGCTDQGCCTAGYATTACVFVADTGGGGGTGGGSGTSDLPIEIPGSEYLPPGSLLRDSPYEHIAGGFNNLGDVSLMGTGYGNAFFTRHYTTSLEDWIAASQQRFQNYLDDNRRRRERFGAGETPAELAKSPFASPFGGGVSRPPPTTAKFENEYMADLESGGFLAKLQMRETGAGLAAGQYVTLEELARQRLREKTGGSLVMDGIPVLYPERAEVQAPDEKSLLEKLKDSLWDKAKGEAGSLKDSLLEKTGLKDVTDRVESAQGILKPFVTDLADIGLSGASQAAEAAAYGSPGRMDALEKELDGRVRERAGQADSEIKEFTWGEFKDNVSGALGELVEVELAGDMAQAAWDAGTDMVKQGEKFAGAVKDKLLQVSKEGGDLEAARKVFKKTLEDFALGQVADAAAEGVKKTGSAAVNGLVSTVFKAKDNHADTGLPKGMHPDEPRWPAGKR